MEWLDSMKERIWRRGVLSAGVLLLILSIVGMFLPVMPGGGTPASYIGNLTVGTLTTPTGRTATFTVAGVNAPAAVKAQAYAVCDGVGDQVEINAAIAALPAERGGLVKLMGGFAISDRITITRRGGADAGSGKVNLQGEGRTLTTITVTPGSGDFDMIGTDGTSIDFIQISDLYLQGDPTMTTGHGINTGGMTYAIFRNLDIRSCKQDGIHNDATEIVTGGSLQNYENIMVTSCGGDGFWLVGWSGMFLKQINCASCYDGFKISVAESQFSQLSADSNTHYGFYVKTATDCTFNELWANWNTLDGLWVETSTTSSFNGIIVQGNQQTPGGNTAECSLSIMTKSTFSNFNIRNTSGAGGVTGMQLYQCTDNVFSTGYISVGGTRNCVYVYTAGGATRSYDNIFTNLQLSGTNKFGTDGLSVTLENRILDNVGYIVGNTGVATLTVAASNAKNPGAYDYQCDGTADEVQINAAIDALTTGGTVSVSQGNFSCTADLSIPAGTTFQGEGNDTIITFSGASILQALTITGANVTIKDMKIVIDAGAGAGGTRPNAVYGVGRHNITLSNLWIVPDTSVADDGASQRQCGIFLDACNYPKITDCYVQDSLRHNIYLRTCYYGSASGNTIDCDLNGYHAVALESCVVFSVTGNAIEGAGAAQSLILLLASTSITVDGNALYSGYHGIYLNSTSFSTISDNTIRDCADGYGIYLITSSDWNTISGNTIKTCGTTGNYDGIHSNECDSLTITSNTIYGCGGDGIQLYRASHCTVAGNTCDTQATGDGIYVFGDGTANADYNTIVGNTCSNNADDGIEIAGGTDANSNLVQSNQVTGNSGTAIVDAGTATSIKNNEGYIAPGETRTYAGALVPTGTCTATTATGVFTESPAALKPGVNTLHCTTSGTLTVVIPTGSTAVATSGDSVVTDSPKACPAGTTVVTVTTGAGADDFTITVTPIVFSWHNPFAQDILVTKVVVNITTKGGTATSEIEVGIADDAVATNRGVEFFDTLDADAAAAVHDSWVAGGGGTQTVWVACQDSASATDGWVVGEIKTEIADALVGSYYVTIVGQ